MYAKRYSVTIHSGATTFSSWRPSGKLCEIRYVLIDFESGSTIAVTGEDTGTPIWTETSVNASTTRAPRRATCDIIGVASLYDTISNELVEDKIVLADERIKIIVTGGGTGRTGTLHFTFE